MLYSLGEAVRRAKVANAVAAQLAHLDALERSYDVIPDALRYERSPVMSAYGALAYARHLVRDQIKAIRGWANRDHLPPTEHDERMASLYRDLQLYRRLYRTRFGELMPMLRAAEAAPRLMAAE